MSDAPILEGLHRVSDLAAADDFQKKHTPFIECVREGDRVRVHVKVGHYVAHPNVPDHWIDWIDLYVNDMMVERFSFGAVLAEPDVTFVLNVDPGSKITAIEDCNLHGQWAADAVAP